MLAKKNSAGKCVIGALVTVLLLAGCSPPGPRAVLKGKRLLESGRPAEAVEELKNATALMQTNAQAWNYLGLAYHHSGDFANGAQAYQQALKLDRDLMEAHFNLGCLWLEQNRLDAAKTEFAAYTLRRPNDPAGWLKLSGAQLRSRELAAAEKSFNEGLRLDASNPEALNGLGLIQMQRNHPREAAQLFNSALEARPGYAPALLNLAIVSHSQASTRSLALQKYREYLALPVRPADWEAVNGVANALQQELSAANRPAPSAVANSLTSNPAPVRAASNPVVRANVPPPRTEPTSSVTTVARTPAPVSPIATSQVVRTGSESPGRSAPATATETPKEPAPAVGWDEPPTTQRRPGFFQRLFRGGSNESARAASRPASSTIETQRPAPVARALTPAPETTADSSPAIARYPYQSRSKPAGGDRLAAEKLFMQGLQHHRAGHVARAVETYRQATETDPAYFEAYYNLALAAQAVGDLPLALNAGETALTIRPESLDARLNFAQALRQGDYFFDAANELATVLLKDSNNARANLALGNLYAQQFHQPAKARTHYLKVLDADPRNPQAAAIRQWLVANPR